MYGWKTCSASRQAVPGGVPDGGVRDRAQQRLERPHQLHDRQQ